MRQCLVILAKTPIFSDVKTRLKSKIGKKKYPNFLQIL